MLYFSSSETFIRSSLQQESYAIKNKIEANTQQISIWFIIISLCVWGGLESLLATINCLKIV